MKYFAVIVAVLLLAGVAYADQTGTTFWHSHSYTDNVGVADRYSEYQKKRDMPMGVGLDVVLYEFEGSLNDYGLTSVNTEYKWDVSNNEQSIYGVVHVNAWKTVKNLMK